MTWIIPQILNAARGLFKGPSRDVFAVPEKKKMGAAEDQLACTKCDWVGEKRDPNGKVQDDQVAAAATPHCVPTTGQSYWIHKHTLAHIATIYV